MTPEDKLTVLFRAEAAPPRDFAFETMIVERVAAQRFWATIGAMVPLTLAAAVGLWGLQPLWPHMLRGLGHAVAAIPQLIPAIVVTGVASGLAASLIWLSRRVLPL